MEQRGEIKRTEKYKLQHKVSKGPLWIVGPFWSLGHISLAEQALIYEYRETKRLVQRKFLTNGKFIP